MITIKGILSHFTYQNPDNHYAIARLRVEKIFDAITIVGHLAGVFEGESLEVKGKWTTHPRFGDQFMVETYTVVLPATVSGIRKYLGSGMIKGIGKSLADKIVDHFEENTLEVIENEPEKLLTVNGIGESKKAAIEQAWNRHHSVRKVMQFLQENEVGVTHTSAILQAYGSKALHILQKEPYLIARDIPGVGFSIADRIALKAGIPKEDENRLQACLICSLLQLEQDGHVYGLKSRFLPFCSKLSQVEVSKLVPALDALEAAGDIFLEPETEDTKVYLMRLHQAESGIASRIKAILSMPARTDQVDKEKILETVLARLAVKLSDEQLHVISSVLLEKIVVITGGPGTGKTTLIRALCEIFRLQQLTVVLGAPTGRAARRLAAVTGQKAYTLHKLLGFDPETQTFERHFANPLNLDIFVVDEASMVDTQLMYRLLEAMPAMANLLLVGDTFQLPSVGPGNVLLDIIESGRVNVFFLTKIFRQAEQSPIIRYAHHIRNGEMPEFEKTPPDERSEFYFIENQNPEKMVETILALCSKRIPKAFPHIEEIQVLTPMHRGEAGTINLNQKLQQVLNPGDGGLVARGIVFKSKDKVMHLKNNYEKEVFNGDIGVVHEVIKAEGRLWVDYDGRLVEYTLLDLDELTLAYAISVHKSQGSEYAAVIIALSMAHFPLLQRNLLYTAMTRGKQLVIIVGSSRAFRIAMDNNHTALRLTGLKEKLMEP